MKLFKINLLNVVSFLLLISLVSAETTFSDQNDIFVIGQSATSSSTEETTNEIIEKETGGWCKYKWNCTNWDECLSNENQIRNCTNVGTCPNKYKSPETNQSCNYTAKFDSPTGTGKIIWLDFEHKPRNLIYFIIGLLVIILMIYLNRNYIRKKLYPEKNFE
jgi:hypothetical protein